VKESNPQAGECVSYLLTETWLIYCSIAVLCTTEGHIWQGINTKLFSDGLISMKFSLPVLLLKPVTVGSGTLSVSDTYLLFGVNYISWPSQYWSLVFDDQLVSFSGFVIWPVKIISEMTYYVLSRTLNPTHSLSQQVLVILHKVSMPLLFCWHQLQLDVAWNNTLLLEVACVIVSLAVCQNFNSLYIVSCLSQAAFTIACWCSYIVDMYCYMLLFWCRTCTCIAVIIKFFFTYLLW